MNIYTAAAKQRRQRTNERSTNIKKSSKKRNTASCTIRIIMIKYQTWMSTKMRPYFSRVVYSSRRTSCRSRCVFCSLWQTPIGGVTKKRCNTRRMELLLIVVLCKRLHANDWCLTPPFPWNGVPGYLYRRVTTRAATVGVSYNDSLLISKILLS